MCFTTNGDLAYNQKAIYNELKKIERNQTQFFAILKDIVSAMKTMQKDIVELKEKTNG